MHGRAPMASRPHKQGRCPWQGGTWAVKTGVCVLILYSRLLKHPTLWRSGPPAQGGVKCHRNKLPPLSISAIKVSHDRKKKNISIHPPFTLLPFSRPELAWIKFGGVGLIKITHMAIFIRLPLNAAGIRAGAGLNMERFPVGVKPARWNTTGNHQRTAGPVQVCIWLPTGVFFSSSRDACYGTPFFCFF